MCSGPVSKQEMKQSHHGSGWKKFCCFIEEIMQFCKWRINHDNLLRGWEVGGDVLLGNQRGEASWGRQ